MKEFLTRLLESLNALEVRGRNNVDILLGCMLAVEQAIEQIDSAENGDKKEEDENG